MTAEFYLGTSHPTWLWRMAIPLFLSDMALRRRVSPWPRATAPWACDSGAYTELTRFGRFTTTPEEYAGRLDRYQRELGGLRWAAPQDWLCDPGTLEATGLTVREHQERTIASVVALRALTTVPIIPSLQGWETADYVAHVALYAAAGIDVTAEPVVGVGSIAARGAGWEAEAIITTLAGMGIRIHGFGVKAGGLARYADHLTSVDSMAWSYEARRNPPLPGHPHKACQNCPTYALRWRERTVRHLHYQQGHLTLGG